jgi:hypothetical protein
MLMIQDSEIPSELQAAQNKKQKKKKNPIKLSQIYFKKPQN